MDRLLYEEYMRFVLAYEMQEALYNTNCSQCTAGTDTCTVASAADPEAADDAVCLHILFCQSKIKMRPRKQLRQHCTSPNNYANIWLENC